MNNIIVQDVMEVYARDIQADKAYFFGLISANDITQTVKQEAIRGGVGNGVISTLQSDKEIKFKVTTAINNDDILSIQSGSAFADGQFTIQKTEEAKLVADKLAISGTPKGTAAVVFDRHGKSYVGTITSGQVAITGGTEGEIYTVVYPSDVTGEVLDLRSDKFPNAHYIEMHTIGYDAETNEVACDIYYVFHKALPDGNINASYAAGQNKGNEVSFTALLPVGSKEYGKYIVVPRA